MRKGMMLGRGKGYKNVVGKDPIVHRQSAKGIKQPQRMRGMVVMSRYGKDMPVTELPTIIKGLKQKEVPKAEPVTIKEVKPEPQVTEIKEDYLSKVAERQEKKPSKVITALSRAGSAAIAFGSTRYKEYQAAAREKAREKKEAYIEELRDVSHPLVKKRDKIEANIEALEQKIAMGVGDEDRHFDELEILKEQLSEVEDEIKNVELSTFTDEQLKGLAVRTTEGDDLFSLDTGNKYEQELVRRIQYRKELDAKMKEAHRTRKEGEEDLFDF
jgi:hypothetical protein